MVIGNTIYSVVGQERLDAKNTSEKDRTFCKVRSFVYSF
ncbi:DNA alkylation repair enzyme [Aggregatibacter aphrophilus NJ8700]|nr:DNA alkylation repair enzyme [Aggregatibacter aphrophilus NJ8700]